MKTTIEKNVYRSPAAGKGLDYLSDPAKVVPCVPGAQLTEQLDERHYRGTVTLKVGPVSASYKGEITIETLDHETHTIQLVGKGLDARGKGSASMTMRGQARALDDGTTEITNRIEISVTGMLAQFGSRLIEDVSSRLFDQFTECFESLLAGEAPEDAGQALSAGSLIREGIKSVAGRFFGKKEGE
ncbi:CoxG family protein [Rhodothermus marinus]|uniref:CoxG family protein n=1 Tax=Rhodothermus marinus TaxID=29549 RepID=UPI000AC4CC70|nr:SRPBCC family protein [Rhodothermus marinus]